MRRKANTPVDSSGLATVRPFDRSQFDGDLSLAQRESFQNTSLPARLPAPAVKACSEALQRIDGGRLSSVGITSTLRREGRSTVAAATALALRHHFGRRTVLVELDLQSPSLASTLGVNEGPGVADCIRGDTWLENCIQWHDDDFGVLTAGHAAADLPPLTALTPFRRLMEELASITDVTVADLPPLPPAGHGAHFSPLCSTLILVTRAGATPVGAIRNAVMSLDRVPYVILNDVRHPVPRWLRSITER